MTIRKQTKIWTTKDGRKIRICDMTDEHLENTIKLLERATKRAEQNLIKNLSRASMAIQGEMAQDAIDAEIDGLMFGGGLYPEEEYPIYYNLVLERERRKRQ